MKIDDTVVTFKDAPSCLSGNLTNKTEGQFCKVFLSELQIKKLIYHTRKDEAFTFKTVIHFKLTVL